MIERHVVSTSIVISYEYDDKRTMARRFASLHIKFQCQGAALLRRYAHRHPSKSATLYSSC